MAFSFMCTEVGWLYLLGGLKYICVSELIMKIQYWIKRKADCQVIYVMLCHNIMTAIDQIPDNDLAYAKMRKIGDI